MGHMTCDIVAFCLKVRHLSLPNGNPEAGLKSLLLREIGHNREKPMTHHISYEVAVLAGIVSLYLSVFALPTSRGLAGQRTNIQAPGSSEDLSRMLEHEDPHVRRSAAWALGETGPKAKSAVFALVEVVQRDNAVGVRGTAAWALGKMRLADTAPSVAPAVGGSGGTGRCG